MLSRQQLAGERERLPVHERWTVDLNEMADRMLPKLGNGMRLQYPLACSNLCEGIHSSGRAFAKMRIPHADVNNYDIVDAGFSIR